MAGPPSTYRAIGISFHFVWALIRWKMNGMAIANPSFYGQTASPHPASIEKKRELIPSSGKDPKKFNVRLSP